MKPRLAVVLFNLGGPDSLAAVEPFLFNLFRDRAIIRLPGFLRWPLAKLISRRRAPVARGIYEKLGGSSPLLKYTRHQAHALERRLQADGYEARAFPCMRYWHPMSEAVVEEVLRFGPDRLVLLPLYPQFSTTTTASSLTEWRRAADVAGLQVETHAVCCYPTDAGFVGAVAELIRLKVEVIGLQPPFRVLFSAHGLPKRVVAAGDPYQWQVEQTAAAGASALGDLARDHVVCYQSRVGPLEWIGPSTEAELERAAHDGVPVVVVPIAFVSEHSETLVELDIEYRERAAELGVPAYARVETVDAAEPFIDGLAVLVEDALTRSAGPCSADGRRRCPASFGGCPCRTSERS
jgi:protoporphyrin/coproporphyrin ferrochelatase